MRLALTIFVGAGGSFTDSDILCGSQLREEVYAGRVSFFPGCAAAARGNYA